MDLVTEEIKKQKKLYKYKNYVLNYEVYYKDRLYHAVSSPMEAEDVVFSCESKKEATACMRSWFKERIDTHQIHKTLRENHDIRIVAPPVLQSVKEGYIGYHITNNELHETIAKDGLKMAGTPCNEVDLASKEIDKYKPGWIPEWVQRSRAVYFHTELTNYCFQPHYEKNSHVYAVSLRDKPAWLGSISIGGFALFGDWMMENAEELQEHIKAIKAEYGPEYWKYSCSLEDYIQNKKRIRKKDNHYGLDEVLIFEDIPKEEVFHIGSWDNQGNFIEGPYFSQFVRNEVKEQYKDILSMHTY